MDDDVAGAAVVTGVSEVVAAWSGGAEEVAALESVAVNGIVPCRR